jgi:hypothetical protein
MERHLDESTLRKAIDRVMPFILKNLLLKGDNRRLIIRDDKYDCSYILDGMKFNRKNKDARMKIITVIDSLHVTSNQHGRDNVRLVKARY